MDKIQLMIKKAKAQADSADQLEQVQQLEALILSRPDVATVVGAVLTLAELAE